MPGDRRRVTVFVLEHELAAAPTSNLPLPCYPSTFVVASVTVKMKDMVGVRMSSKMLAQVIESWRTQQVNARRDSAAFNQVDQRIGN